MYTQTLANTDDTVVIFVEKNFQDTSVILLNFIYTKVEQMQYVGHAYIIRLKAIMPLIATDVTVTRSVCRVTLVHSTKTV